MRTHQRFGGWAAILSAGLLVVVMVLMQTAMKGIEGEDVYEKTVNSLATYPVVNWIAILVGTFAIIVLFWTVEAVEERLRSRNNVVVGGNVSRFGYFHLLTYSLYMLLPAAVLHDLANEDKNIAEALVVIHPITELGLVLSVLSCIFFSLWAFQVGYLILKSKTFSKALGVFTIVVSAIVLISGCYEALYGRGLAFGIILSILTFLGAFVVWKVWVGIELIRGEKQS